MERRIEDILDRFRTKLEVPVEDEEIKPIHYTQNQVYNLVHCAKLVAKSLGLERK